MTSIWIYAKKYWKIAIAALGVIAAFIVLRALLMRIKRAGVAGVDNHNAQALQHAVSFAKDQIAAAQEQAAVEISVARSKDTERKQELAEAIATPDPVVKRNKIKELGAKYGL